MVDGRLLYDGPPEKIKDNLTEFGFKVPKGTPPLEYYLELIDKGSVRLEMFQDADETADESKEDIEAEEE